MKGLICTKKVFTETTTEDLCTQLLDMYPETTQSQAQSWSVLVDDIKNCDSFDSIPDDIVFAIEYSLPTEGMALDFMFCGLNAEGKKEGYIVESKQWNDTFINQLNLSEFREPEKELHPQIQVNRHKISFLDYLSTTSDYVIKPYVYIRNCSDRGIQQLLEKNPKPSTIDIPVINKLNDVLSKALELTPSSSILDDLNNAEFKPSKRIIDAMGAIVTREEPFVLTPNQEEVIRQVKENIADGKKIIRIIGAAGSGKTAILLNLYVDYLNEMDQTGLRPRFISGAQNTWLYKSLYPEVEQSFNFSFSVMKTLPKTLGHLYVIMMDEAQHNSAGLITTLLNGGATLILCYDTEQAISANNSLEELANLETRDDFVTIQLEGSVRFSGSQKAENNIKKCLNGERDFEEDDLFDFQCLYSFKSFQDKIISIMQEHPESTSAVVGLLSKDSDDYTYQNKDDSILYTEWGSKTECQWIPYIDEKDYLNKNNGKIWVGTWWLPGLDVDYVFVIVGGDGMMTSNGFVANPDLAKHYRMEYSIAEKLGFPEELFLIRKNFGKVGPDYFRTSIKINEYIKEEGHEENRDEFMSWFSTYLKNNYYIMATRGVKGCYIYFTQSEFNEEE